jgi:hypothetical protein
MRNKIHIYSSKLEHKALSLCDVYKNCHNKKKNFVNLKIKFENPSNKITMKMITQVDTTQRKKKKQTINKSQVFRTPCKEDS